MFRILINDKKKINANIVFKSFMFSIVFVLVFYAYMNIFLSIISGSFCLAQENINDDNQEIFLFMLNR